MFEGIQKPVRCSNCKSFKIAKLVNEKHSLFYCIDCGHRKDYEDIPSDDHIMFLLTKGPNEVIEEF